MRWSEMVLEQRVVREAAAELQRRRQTTTGRVTQRDQKVALAEASVMGLYDMELLEENLERVRKSLFVLPVDHEGRRVRVITRDFVPLRVYERLMDTDIVVFVCTPDDKVDILGWLPSWRIADAPSGEINGDKFYEVEEQALEPMPATFDFTESCAHVDVGEHAGEFGGIWNQRHNGWECCNCERIVYDPTHTEWREQFFHGKGDQLFEKA